MKPPIGQQVVSIFFFCNGSVVRMGAIWSMLTGGATLDLHDRRLRTVRVLAQGL